MGSVRLNETNLTGQKTYKSTHNGGCTCQKGCGKESFSICGLQPLTLLYCLLSDFVSTPREIYFTPSQSKTSLQDHPFVQAWMLSICPYRAVQVEGKLNIQNDYLHQNDSELFCCWFAYVCWITVARKKHSLDLRTGALCDTYFHIPIRPSIILQRMGGGVFWVYIKVSKQLDVPRKPPNGGAAQEASLPDTQTTLTSLFQRRMSPELPYGENSACIFTLFLSVTTQSLWAGLECRTTGKFSKLKKKSLGQCLHCCCPICHDGRVEFIII